ncbi:hypothetical protein FRB94_005150 [Tulasnella sp. JGI-2019a]|nr:hypothetical protein FRB94_005150 [Tulasnella sp. JGI-2019a]KAG9017750.1 hypothetical protein FRB93_004561 [Tulasnella sp. JGI-2019a]
MVWKHEDMDNTGPDNTMFVANCPNAIFPGGTPRNVYVVAIAGTATTSVYDWDGEDLAVTNVVDFEDWYATWPTAPNKVTVAPHEQVKKNPNKPYITESVANGIYVLMTQVFPQGSQQLGTTFGAFIATLPSDACIIFTGHSLRGTLSPTLALGLVGSNMLSKVIVGGGKNAFPFSGANSDYQALNGNYFNTRDVVQQVWCQSAKVSPGQHIMRIAGLWDEKFWEKKALEYFVWKHLLVPAEKSGVTYQPLPGNSFTAPNPTIPFPKLSRGVRGNKKLI